MITDQDLHRPDTPILLDGGMGTELLRRGVVPDELPDICNVESPGHVLDVHTAYIEAGSQVLQTNTFGANRFRLSSASDNLTVKEVISAACGLAHEAAHGRALVAGTIGPLGQHVEPHGSLPLEEARAAFGEIVEQFLLADVRIAIIETMTTVDEASIAVRQALVHGISTVAVTLTFSDGPNGPQTACGTSPSVAIAKLQDIGAHIVGSNCGSGVASMREVVREIIRVAGVPVLIQSGAGIPDKSGPALEYPVYPSAFASFAKELKDLGVRIVGGCCGTTPEHIRQAAKILR